MANEWRKSFTPSAAGGDRLKIEDGGRASFIIRSAAVVTATHFFDDGGSPAACTGEGCVNCASGKPAMRNVMQVFDVDNQAGKLWETSHKMLSEVADEVDDFERKHPGEEAIIQVRRRGTGMQTKYSVKATDPADRATLRQAERATYPPLPAPYTRGSRVSREAPAVPASPPAAPSGADVADDDLPF